MEELNIYNCSFKSVGKISLEEGIFAVEVNKSLMHEDVRHYLAEKRSGNACTKNRSDVSGGGAKPWRQKGTGRARQGSRRSPLWKGGGTVFGPVPRSYGYSFPKKKRWGALKSALTDKFNGDALMILDNIEVQKPKTKHFMSILSDLKLEDKKVLILVDNNDPNLLLSTRNLKRVSVMRPMQVRSYHVLYADMVVFTKDSLETFQRQLV